MYSNKFVVAITVPIYELFFYLLKHWTLFKHKLCGILRSWAIGSSSSSLLANLSNIWIWITSLLTQMGEIIKLLGCPLLCGEMAYIPRNVKTLLYVSFFFSFSIFYQFSWHSQIYCCPLEKHVFLLSIFLSKCKW